MPSNDGATPPTPCAPCDSIGTTIAAASDVFLSSHHPATPHAPHAKSARAKGKAPNLSPPPHKSTAPNCVCGSHPAFPASALAPTASRLANPNQASCPTPPPSPPHSASPQNRPLAQDTTPASPPPLAAIHSPNSPPRSPSPRAPKKTQPAPLESAFGLSPLGLSATGRTYPHSAPIRPISNPPLTLPDAH